MCLSLRENSTVRYKSKSRRRWKAVSRYLDFNNEPQFVGIYQRGEYKRGVWIEAKGDENLPTHFGFHVFVDKAPALTFENEDEYAIQVEVKGFLQSGTFCGKKCETYRYIRVPKNPKLH